MKYNLSKIMSQAWQLFRKLGIDFSECLRRAWASAKAAAGIQEEANTWAGWQRMGYEVKHGSKALFGVDLIWATKGTGEVYKARFFGASQVAAIA